MTDGGPSCNVRVCGKRVTRPHIPGDENRRLALTVLWRAFPARLAVVGLLCLLGGMIPALFVVLVARLAVDLPNAIKDGWSSTAGHLVLRTLIFVGAPLLGQEAITALREVLRWDLYRRYEEYLVARVVTATVTAPGMDLFEDPDLARLTDQAVRIAQLEPGDLVDGLSTKWAARAPGLAAIVLVATVWPLAAAVMAVVWVAAGQQMQADSRRMDREHWAESMRRAAYLNHVAQDAAWAKEVRVFGLVSWLNTRFIRRWNVILSQMIAARRNGRRRTGIVLSVALLTNGAVFAWAVREAVNGSLGVGDMTLLAQGLLTMASIADNSGDQLIEYGASRPPIVTELERAIAQQSSPRPGNRSADGLPTRHIHFDHVSFGYAGRDRPVFDDLNLRIDAGSSLAVVGLNGAGKTTLVKLLAGLEQPQGGWIRLDGTDLAEFDIETWRRSIAAIFQDFVHYELTVRDNIGFGGIEVLSTGAVEGELTDAARQAGAGGVLSDLPSGLDTPLSRRFAGGVDLSGGEWQRIALARSLFAVRAGARVLILDEPTAQLDVRAEADIYDRFLELSRGLTTIVISHRFSTVRRADRIVVLDSGRIREDGNHQQLLAADGVYARLFRKQALRYSTTMEGRDA
ncbi:MAG TPA: ABC transporter ATP-binding protein [Mycobacteriales bacterium]|nr:ABC transporter ATP-binding protein [Mycobacteriales bacterium]